MKKIYCLLAGLTLCLFIAQNAQSLELIQADAGDPVTITVTNSFPFNPFDVSTSVDMAGVTDETAFAVGAFHTMVDQKKSGKQFGMASDSSAMWFIDISETAAEAVAASNSGGFGTGWSKM